MQEHSQPIMQGIISSSLLGLRSPVKFYNSCIKNHSSVNNTSRESRVDQVYAKAGYAATWKRRELQNGVTDRAAQQTVDAADMISETPGIAAEWCHVAAAWQQPHCQVVEGVLQPSKKVMQLNSSLDRAHNIAVLAMQGRLIQLDRELADSRGLRERHKQQVEKMEAVHKQQLQDAQGLLHSKVKVMQCRLADQCLQQLQVALTAKCITAWAKYTRGKGQQLRTLRRVQMVWLKKYWKAWLRLMQARRRGADQALQLQARVLHTWQDLVYMKAVTQQKSRRIVQLRLQHVIHHWMQFIVQQQQLSRQGWRAQLWHRRRRVCRCFCMWLNMSRKKTQKATDMAVRLLDAQAKAAVHAWHDIVAGIRCERQAVLAAQQREERQPHLQALRRAFELWQEHIAAEVQYYYLQHKHHTRLLHRAWQQWARLPAARRQLQRVESAFSAIGAQLLQHWGILAFMQHKCECRARRWLQCWRLRMYLFSWRASAARRARHCRLLAARALVREQCLLGRCFQPWMRLSVTAARQRMAALASELQVMLEEQQTRLCCAQGQAAAAAEELQLLVLHNQELQQQAAGACTAALAGLQFAPSFRWHSLLFNPGEAQLQPRVRHAVFVLNGLQPATHCSSTPQHCPAAPTPAPAASVLLVFGGVAGSTWLTDLSMLVLEESITGDYRLSALPVPCTSLTSSHISHAQGSGTATSMHDTLAGSAAITEQLPAAVLDFSACACGHNQFVVGGGFNGDQQTLDLQLCVLTHSNQQDKCKTGDEPAINGEPGMSHNSSGTMLWCRGWIATWQILQPRNRSPVGRCHHTICHYAEGQSLVVFGGWTNRQGCLNDVWLFHQDHMEWWQPDIAGEDVPGHRRSHAAVLMGHKLFIYGGLDGRGQHLGDLWCLDMLKWEWQQAATKEPLRPAARRAASLEQVEGRYLLLHGGYCGTHQLLNDTWVFDTQSNRWMLVDVAASASELPVPRALHTLTRIGSRFLVLGGQGAAGPVPDVQLLECPAVTRGQQLQRQHLNTLAQLTASKQRCSQLSADLLCSRSEVWETTRQLQTLKVASESLTSQYAAAQQFCSTMQDELSAAQQASSAACVEARQAQQQIVMLERRLLRARAAGNKAVDVAREKAQQLQATDEHMLQVQQELKVCQQQLQHHQLDLSECHAELVTMHSELQECKTRMRIAATAKHSAQTDYEVALARSNKLYTQELQHLQSLLQSSRKAHSHLAEKLAAVQAQPAATASPSADAWDQAHCLASQQQQEVITAEKDQTLPHTKGVVPCVASAPASNNAAVADSVVNSARLDELWECILGGNNLCHQTSYGGAGPALRLSAGQVTALVTRQGKTKADMEILQQSSMAQQEELAKLRQQLQPEKHAAAEAQECYKAAAQQLQLQEQQ